MERPKRMRKGESKREAECKGRVREGESQREREGESRERAGRGKERPRQGKRGSQSVAERQIERERGITRENRGEGVRDKMRESKIDGGEGTWERVREGKKQ